MRNSAAIVTTYVLQRIAEEPLAKRGEMYRALADFAVPNDRSRFLKLADDCDALTAAHDQLMFDFRREGRRT